MRSTKQYGLVNSWQEHQALIKPHVHYGYFHNENGDGKLTKSARNLVDLVNRTWDNHLRKGE